MIIRQHLVVEVGVLIGQAHLRLCLLLADFGGGFRAHAFLECRWYWVLGVAVLILS